MVQQSTLASFQLLTFSCVLYISPCVLSSFGKGQKPTRLGAFSTKAMRASFAWIFFLLVGYVSCRWWGRLIPPFLKRNQRGNRAIKFSETAGAGLVNLGNTCYMNSVLQSLFYSLSYREKVMGSSFAEESVGEKMSWLFEEMEGSGNVDTSQVARALDLNPGTQEDAQEFMLRLLDEVDKSYDTESSEPVSNAFQGYTDQTIQCINVDYSKSRKQRFLDLTVDILGHEKLSAALMDMFSKPDYLIGTKSIAIIFVCRKPTVFMAFYYLLIHRVVVRMI